MASSRGELSLLVLFCFLVVLGGVRGQCPNDSEDRPFKFVGAGESCEVEENGYFHMCQNFLACQTKSNFDNDTICVDGGLKVYSDYPYNQACLSSEDCPTPLQCLYDVVDHSYKCDYQDLPNGYGCESDLQCASKHCKTTENSGVCTPPHFFSGEKGEKEEKGEGVTGGEGGKWWGEDVDSVGGKSCEETWECQETEFCGLGGLCTPSLEEGSNCTSYQSLSMSQNNICAPGLGCFPSSPSNYTCQPIFSARPGQYCDTNTFFCQYSTYCSPTTQQCTNYPTESPTDTSCDSSVLGSCPLGQRCSCEGSVSRSDNLSYVCVDFMNSGCSRNLDTYYECLTDGGCYFDPFTLANNDESSMAPEFLGPLNRFSCAAMQCQKEYDMAVKCQNDKNLVNSLPGFSPIRTPSWASYFDPNFKGWQVALVVVACAVGVVMLVSFGVLLTRENPEYEIIEG